MNISIPKSLLDSSVNGYQISIFAFLTLITRLPSGFAVTLKTIAINSCNGNTQKTKQSLYELKEKGFISYKNEGDVYIFDVPKREKNYLLIDYNVIQTIIKSSYKQKSLMLKHYCFILSNRYYVSKIKKPILCSYSRDYFAEIEEEPIDLLSRCENSLVNLGLLYILRSQNPDKTDVYCLPEHEKYAKVYAEYTDRYNDFGNTDHRRSLMQKYHKLCAGYKYSQKEIKEIKEYIIWYNNHYDYSKRKDVSIFTE